MTRDTDIREIKGIGDKTAVLFHKLSLFCVRDVLTFYPRDYDTYGEPIRMDQVRAGEINTFYGTVSGIIQKKKIRNLIIINTRIQDGSGTVSLTFFNMPYLVNILKPGMRYVFRGNVQRKGTELIMEQAKIFKIDEYQALKGSLQPRYPLTAGLTNNAVIKAAKQVLSLYPFEEDHIPADIKTRYGLVDYRQAVETIHFPQSLDELCLARRRLVFDEFFLFIIAVRRMREQTQALENTAVMLEAADTGRLLEALPYQLTNAQSKVWEEIKNDLSGPFVMNRLIQGDVGSGKTILAFLSLLMCVVNGYQGAMMAPTEVLAMQHFTALMEMTEDYGLPFMPVLLTGSMSAAEKRQAYEKIRSGEANVILGTHALIQEKAEYSNLGLVITDEQHRFGVRQRECLAGKGENVHVLVMSATPIPRTLAIILYGDLHLSVIDELPANRLPIKNCVVNTSYRETAYKFIAKEVANGRQVYIICPMVEEGELEGVENVTDYAEKLKQLLPQQIQIAPLHGKMRPAEKKRIMEEFAAHNIDVIVSTTVIEVGINVPNATVMMVENAERFGLAQLHQLRGRVGRGKHQSYCIFVSGSESKDTMKRLEILNQSNDGFFIAGEDLRLRGPGDLFGIRQSGIMDFKIGDIYQDAGILKEASEAAEQILREEDGLEQADRQYLKKYIEEGLLKFVDFRTI